MKRKLTAWFLALVLTASLLPMSAMADTVEPEGGTQVKQAQTLSENGDGGTQVPPAAASSEAETAEGETSSENVCRIVNIEYESLAAALEAAQEGDEIVLLKDTAESIKITKAITLDLGGKTLTAAEGKRVIEVEISGAGEDAKLAIKNGTITGGNAGKGSGGGICISKAIYAKGSLEKRAVALPVELTGLTIRDNISLGGGGLNISSGIVTLKNCTVSGNRADGSSGGGIYQASGDYEGPSTVCTLINTVIEGNRASGGGAVALGATSYYANIPNIGKEITDVTATLVVGSGSKIIGNEATYQGGGVYLTGNGSRFRMEGGELSGNTARYYGGGLCSINYKGAVITGGSITDNTASYGGGIYIKASEYIGKKLNPLSEERLILGSGVSVKGNHARTYGGGIFVDSYQSAEGVGVEMQRASVYDNTAKKAGDDLYNTGMSGSYFCFAPVGTGWRLTACGDEIDGWYDDSEAPKSEEEPALQAAVTGGRWNAHPENGAVYAKEFTEFEDEEARLTGLLALKAAHGQVFRVLYDGNGGTGTVTDAKSPYTADASVTVLDNGFAYTNYTFTGWNTQRDGKGTSYQAGDIFDIKADTTLYAQWRYTPPYIPPTPTPATPALNTADHYAYLMGYPDGTVQPNGSITRAEATTIFFRLLTEESRTQFWATANSYSDVRAGQWYNNAVSTMTSAGIVNGYPDGTFRPNAPITRAEMAKIIALFAKLDKTADRFPDTAGHWAEAYIRLAAGNGWIEGYPDGTFRPDRSITRAETVTMIDRVLERVPKDESRLLPRSAMLTFPDCTPGQWFYIAVQEAANSHVYERAASERNGDEQWKELRDNRDWTKLEY